MVEAYKNKHRGQTAIICGSAPSLLQEFDEVKKKRPGAIVIGINESVSGIWCEYLSSYHDEKFDYFKSLSLNKEIRTLSSKDYDIVIGGTSCGDAIQIADIMGFSEIIIVGAPMNGRDGYFNDTPEYDEEYGMNRFGSAAYSKETTDLDRNQRVIKELATKLPQVRSMSGFTKEVFGGFNG